MGALKAVWLRYGSSFWSPAAFLRIVWLRVFSAIVTVVNVEAVWQEYGLSLEQGGNRCIHPPGLEPSWLSPDWMPLPTAARATQRGVGTERSSRFTTFSKPVTPGSSLNVFSLVLTFVVCSSSLSSYSDIKAHSNTGGFDELNFCALWGRTWVYDCAASVYFILTSSEDLFPADKGSAITFSKASRFNKVYFVKTMAMKPIVLSRPTIFVSQLLK